MIPPKFGDIGKSAKDIFNKGYNYGACTVDVTKKFDSGIECKCQSNSTLSSMKVTGTVKSEYNVPAQGLSIDGAYSGGKLTSNITLQNKVVRGSKIVVNTKFTPSTGQAAGDIKTSYSQNYINATLDSGLTASAPILVASSSLGHLGFVAGHQLYFDTGTTTITQNNVAIGYQDKETEFYITSNNATLFGTSVFHKLNKLTNIGIQLAWDKFQSDTVRLGVGATYKVDRATSVGVKVNNAGQIGSTCTYSQTPEAKLTCSFLVNLKQITEGGHKLGLGLEFQL